jgi:hypothetical protein
VLRLANVSVKPGQAHSIDHVRSLPLSASVTEVLEQTLVNFAFRGRRSRRGKG